MTELRNYLVEVPPDLDAIETEIDDLARAFMGKHEGVDYTAAVAHVMAECPDLADGYKGGAHYRLDVHHGPGATSGGDVEDEIEPLVKEKLAAADPTKPDYMGLYTAAVDEVLNENPALKRRYAHG